MKKDLHRHRFMCSTLLIITLLFVPLTANLLTNVSSTFAAQTRLQHHYAKIPGHVAPLLQNLTPVGKPAATMLLNHLEVFLKLRNQQSLDGLLVAQERLAAPQYHHYLSPQVFENEFSPTQDTITKVSSYLQARGLHIVSVAPNNLFINVSATVATVDKAFAITLNYYHVRGNLVYAPSTDPTVADPIASNIQCIVGLDNVENFYQSQNPGTHTSSFKTAHSRQVTLTTGYTPADLRNAYGVSPLITSGANGTGQTIALIEPNGYNASDINTFRNTYKLGAGTYSNILVDGATNTPGPHTLEVETDMEVITALAPQATQKVYIGEDSTPGFYNTLNQVISDDGEKIINSGWGDCEAAFGKGILNGLNNILKQSEAQGHAVFVASGDSGAYGCGDNNLNVYAPANNSYAIGVGGTSLHTGINGIYSSEAAWSDPTPIPGTNVHGSGSGGGISTYFNRPIYQTGPYLSSTHRLVPDVSANANPATGDLIYCSITSAGCSGWLIMGGTHIASSLWASVTADINQYLADRNKPTLGNVNADLYLLYSIPQPYPAFHDIINGTNLYYKAGPGYDPATGLGSPIAWNIARDLAVIIPLVILCRASDLSPTVHVAVLCRSASTNTAALVMRVNNDGSAFLTTLPGDGVPNIDTPLPKNTIDSASLAALLKRIGDITKIPEHYCLKPISFATITTTTYHIETSNDLSCLTPHDQQDYYNLWLMVDGILSKYVHIV
ncbi:S53 family peptidase [Dictyobacter kobayashii]|uniref:Peptidase S53 domain-containing protein n=1 Tax=Dictyobacter kobayashii TaxID=2014872 RepID=A0A402AMB1_9CHLR|nr:S53 family peptidase [Dictyobacter kobayashii]GCE20175.1 hypothetical protein KDK_39750 [Dictyobacter kobayashii]